MTRLGSKLPFQQAAEEVWYQCRTRVCEATLRRVTHRYGAAAEAVVKQEVERLEQEAPDATAQPKQLQVSVDGAFVQLTSGEWREVKSIAIGEFSTRWQPSTWTNHVKTEQISYFSRSDDVRNFERYALAELHRRGVDNAQTVVSVNDGAEWIQHFLDYHCPQAVRILDFPHAASYVAQAGKAIWDEGSETFNGWFKDACHRLKHEPAEQTIANLKLLRVKAKTDADAASIDGALFYLQRRRHMLDYAHFQKQGYPIGSGSVESGHKVVVQQRMKGAGMRWAEPHVNSMLALRNHVCNGTWEDGWQQAAAYRQTQRTARRVQAADAKQPAPPEPITFARLKAKGLLSDAPIADAPPPAETSRDAADHPWRNNKWPTKEAWRWK